jgi:hypothetical protein
MHMPEKKIRPQLSTPPPMIVDQNEKKFHLIKVQQAGG